MTRHENQQGIRLCGEQLPVRLDHQRVFPFAGTGSDPHRPLLRLPLLTQRHSARQHTGIHLLVKLDRTGNLDRLGPSAQGNETLGLGLALHSQQVEFSEHRRR